MRTDGTNHRLRRVDDPRPWYQILTNKLKRNSSSNHIHDSSSIDSGSVLTESEADDIAVKNHQTVSSRLFWDDRSRRLISHEPAASKVKLVSNVRFWKIRIDL